MVTRMGYVTVKQAMSLVAG